MEKVTTSIRKIVKSLSTSKGRKLEGAFVTERSKNVLELLDGPFELRWLIGTEEWFRNYSAPLNIVNKTLLASKSDMERMTSLKTPSQVIAVFELPPEPKTIELDSYKLYVAVDQVQDPGNMGTLLRLCDWFGVDTILASENSVDIFNPKCVISSMGSICRVKTHYCDLPELLDEALHAGVNVWGAFLEGESIYELPNDKKTTGIILLGNEGNGISKEVESVISQRISIPTFPPDKRGAESLNVAIAGAIILSEFRRRTLL